MQIKNHTYILFFVLLLLASCTQQKEELSSVVSTVDLKEILKSDTLRVATMYGSTSYFMFKDETMGYDYELVSNLAKYLKLNLKISIAKSEDEMIQLLEEKKVDIIAYNLVETKDNKKRFKYVLPQQASFQVLVQNMAVNALTEVTELAGKSIMVKENSVFHNRLLALNDEIGGSIDIILAADSLSNSDLIEQVANKKINYTLAYNNTALLYKSYYKRLDHRMAVGFKQHNGWLVRKESKELFKTMVYWNSLPKMELLQSKLFSKYWDKSPYFALRKIKIPKGAISPFDELFKKYSPLINWDWRLLAALAFHESRFDASEVSHAGARGLMQLMPRTASNFGLNRNTILDPESNIEAGVQYIKSLNLAFHKVENKNERLKFILAGYNCGPAHIFDAMALARKYGKNPYIWSNHVEYFLLKKSESQFYDDPVVKYGYYRGNHTVRYVQNTLDTYKKYLNRK